MSINRTEKIRVAVNGKLHEGTRQIEGAQKMRQTIFYGESSRLDGHTYKPNEESLMLNSAYAILRELVSEALTI